MTKNANGLQSARLLDGQLQSASVLASSGIHCSWQNIVEQQSYWSQAAQCGVSIKPNIASGT